MRIIVLRGSILGSGYFGKLPLAGLPGFTGGPGFGQQPRCLQLRAALRVGMCG